MRRIALIAALIGVAFAVAPGVASAFSCGVSLDKFNRADSATLGPNWAEQTNPNNVAIAGNAATNSASTQALATFNPRGAREACLDVSTGGTGLQYAAIVLRHGDLNNSVFLKVQNQDGDNTFELAYFYRGNNGQGGTLRPSAGITAPFTSGRIHVWSKGTKARLDIDTDFDNKPEQSFNVTGIATGGLGQLIGIAGFGGAIMDNFRTAPPQTTITKHPSKTTSNHSATFKFKSSIAGSHFKCKRDGSHFKSCASPKIYSGLANGKHTFRVKAIDSFGNPDPTPATFTWRIT